MGEKLEIWKDIKGYEGYYQISSFGRVMRNKKILKNKSHNHGYLTISLSCMGEIKYYTIHRLVALNFIPNPLNKLEINHKDGNKHNNKIDNLEWVTKKENCEHASINNLTPSGEKHFNSILIEKQVIEIREKSKYFGYRKLAKKYNVGKSTIRDIVKNITWRHLL